MIKKLRLFSTLLLLAVVSAAWGAEQVYKTALFGSDYNSKGVSSYTDTWTATNSDFTVSLANFNNNNNNWNVVKCGRKNNASVATITTSAAIDKAVSKVVVTIDAITAGNVNSITLYTSADNSTWTEAGSFDKSTGTKEVSLSTPTANLYYKVEFDCASGTSNGLVTVSKVEYYAETGGDAPTLKNSDLAINGAPVALNFDLYNNASAQTVNFTTSSTGTVTVGESEYITTSVSGNTITVTPVKVTPSAQTITVSQAADATYEAGTASFTVSITDSTPFEGGDVTFVGGTDKGTTTGNNSADAVTKSVITMSSTDAAFATDEYRFYKDSETTFSVPEGYYITKIVFTDAGTSNPCSNLNRKNGTAGEFDLETLTWTGASRTAVFVASAQARASQIVVSVATGTPKQTPTVEISATELEVNGDVATATVTTNGPTVTLTTSDSNVASVSGTTVTAVAAGTATITATWEENETYIGGKKTFTVTVSEQSGEALTATATFDATKDKASTGSTATEWSITKDGITIAVSNGVGGNGTEYRIYKNQTLTISSVSGNIKKIEFVETTSNPITGFGDIEGFNKDTKTWEGSAESVTFTASTAQVRLAGINVTYEVPTGFVAAPEFSINGGTVVAGTEVTITAEEGNTIVYTTDGTDPSESSTAIGPSEGNVVTITINEAMTIKAIAMDEDANSSEVAEATFDIAKVYESIAALIADKPEKATLRLTDAQVLFVGDNDVYVKDATGALDFFKTGLSYSAGDVLNGTIDVAFTMYNTYTPEVTEVSNNNLTSTSGEVVAETVEANAVTLEKVNYLVSLEGFFNNKSVAGVPVYDKYKVVTDAFGALEDGDYVKVTGIVVNSKGVANIGLTAVEKIDAPTVTATITDAGYATFANENAVDFSAETGLTVMTAQYDADNDKIVYTEVTSKKVPAGKAVVLKGTAGDYEGKVIASADPLENNGLKVDLTNNTPATGKEYCLARLNGVVGFYKVATTTYVKAGKAYLEIERPATTGGAKDFYAIEDETDGINAINNSHQTVESVYNLSGQRVNKAQKGIYIVNGKKVVMK